MNNFYFIFFTYFQNVFRSFAHLLANFLLLLKICEICCTHDGYGIQSKLVDLITGSYAHVCVTLWRNCFLHFANITFHPKILTFADWWRSYESCDLELRSCYGLLQYITQSLNTLFKKLCGIKGGFQNTASGRFATVLGGRYCLAYFAIKAIFT